MTPEQIEEARIEIAGHDSELLADYLKMALNALAQLEADIAQARRDSGWCATCKSNTHPNWCKHSEAAGHDLAEGCFEPDCCGTGDRPKEPKVSR